ncbi:hypothetical protein [Acinetobacter sp.]|uniref:hypothetical protein n=1 Tax=Acinetobacter sp. TaxID=472 RepID=UPI002FCB7F10
MKKKTFLIQIFLLLFTFQSIWNVAEAACLHEMPNVTSFLNDPSLAQPIAQSNDNKQSLVDDQKIYDYCQKICFNDRCSHLSNHIALELDTQSYYNDKPNFQVDIRHARPWANFYQSPYLPRLAPPPELSPLAVG